MKKRVRFLHIVMDEKFTIPVIDGFSIDVDIESEYICFHDKSKNLQYVGGDERIVVYDKRCDLIDKIINGCYDVLYLHSFPFILYKFIKYIPKDKIVIWWAWGYDIYGYQIYNLKSFVNIDVYKPSTNSVRNRCFSFLDKLKILMVRMISFIPHAYYRRKILQRVDFFQPVCHFEYLIMKKISGFNAREYYPKYFYKLNSLKIEDFSYKYKNGNILLGNSASVVNNHLDAWEAISEYIPHEKRVIVPLNYGDMEYGKIVKSKIEDKKRNVLFLDSFLPVEEYFKIMDNCSYAVYGSLRQHAMGNIINGIKKGIKIFLYKDSLIYKYFKERGFIVFAIEDVNHESFVIPLNKEEVLINYKALNKEMEFCKNTGESAMKLISHQLFNK